MGGPAEAKTSSSNDSCMKQDFSSTDTNPEQAHLMKPGSPTSELGSMYVGKYFAFFFFLTFHNERKPFAESIRSHYMHSLYISCVISFKNILLHMTYLNSLSS